MELPVPPAVDVPYEPAPDAAYTTAGDFAQYLGLRRSDVMNAIHTGHLAAHERSETTWVHLGPLLRDARASVVPLPAVPETLIVVCWLAGIVASCGAWIAFEANASRLGAGLLLASLLSWFAVGWLGRARRRAMPPLPPDFPVERYRRYQRMADWRDHHLPPLPSGQAVRESEARRLALRAWRDAYVASQAQARGVAQRHL